MYTLKRLRFGLTGLLLCLMLFMLASSLARAADTTATVVWFEESEPGIDPYPVRFIVTPDYMRSDDGLDDGDFLLFDRHQRRIYSVARDTRTVLAIDGKGESPKAPQTLAWHVRERADTGAPAIAGISPVELALEAGGEVCHTALVAPGFLDPVRVALQEFSQSLAVQQLRTLDHTPSDLQTPCFLSRYLYASDFHVARGMPLADWNAAGKRREMTRYRTDMSVDEKLFVVPDDFTVIPAAAD
jgi:hypothetical protein